MMGGGFDGHVSRYQEKKRTYEEICLLLSGKQNFLLCNE